MWLVTAATILVSGDGAALLGLVTIRTELRQAPAVWLVARRTLSMAFVGLCALSSVTGVASGDALLRSVRQARVTALAGLVSGLRLNAGQLDRMARRASASIRRLAYEIVRRVAALALDASMKVLVARRVLVAGAAVSHACSGLGAGGVRVMATNARADLALLRMVRVLVGMTARAGLIGAAQHVVGRVAVRAIAVASGVARAQHGEILVAGATGHGFVFGELVGLMTADAGDVTPFEQSRSRYHRLRLLVTGDAGSQRLGASSVLLLVTGRTNLVRCLAADGVSGLDVLMTALARPGLRRRVLVWTMTIEALTGVVNLHRGRERLAAAVTMKAIPRLVLVQLLMFG
jgi:hypothetical protein